MITDAKLKEYEGWLNAMDGMVSEGARGVGTIREIIERLRKAEVVLMGLHLQIDPIAQYVERDCITNGDSLCIGDRWLDREYEIQAAVEKVRAHFEETEK
ncbi:MAG: hypothetical protein E6R04_07300 [Spirochaetes bacterium]|nr:MAG: hypothetical protein E6R04_07300 [Spirochaetota bacterium]